jgi:hypothetical protein
VITVSFGNAGRDEVVRMTVDIEGAEYIADVMESEQCRTGDHGARDIAAEIRAALAIREETRQ